MTRWVVMTVLAVSLVAGCGDEVPLTRDSTGTDFLEYSRIRQAQQLADGRGVTVAVADWMFDLRGPAARKYVQPTSVVPGEDVGDMEPWHGEWMAEIVHQVAPAARIIPIRARARGRDDYQAFLVEAIRVAADLGAVAVASSMGPTRMTPQLREAVADAEARGTLFVDVHPEVFPTDDGGIRICEGDECCPGVIHTGVVPVPEHPATYLPAREVYVWPYGLRAYYKDGWGYSNGPPQVAGVLALMKSADPTLSPGELRETLIAATEMRDGFPVLDADAAVRAAVRSRGGVR